MNESDRELKAIRQKLETLKTSPAPPEAAAAPWLPARQTQTVPVQTGRPAPGPDPNMASNLAQVTAAIHALRQRSELQPAPSQFAPGQPAYEAASPRPDVEWLAQAMQQFNAQVSRINQLGQQQGAALLGLRQLADQVELELERRNWDTPPELDAVIQFLLEQEAVSVPQVEQARGQLKLTYQTVDFYQAENEAMATAHALRHSGGYGEASPSSMAQVLEDGRVHLQAVWDWGQAQLHRVLTPAAGPPRGRTAPQPFTLFDGAIWFSGAAIARVLLDMVFQFYPGLWTPLVVLLIGAGAIALYRMLSRRTGGGFSFHLLVIAAGLVIGGRFI